MRSIVKSTTLHYNLVLVTSRSAVDADEETDKIANSDKKSDDESINSGPIKIGL